MLPDFPFCFFFFFSKTRAFVSLPDRDLSARWAYVHFSRLFLMLICGQVSSSCSYRHRSFPWLWPTVSTLFLITAIKACVCLQVAAKPVSLTEGSDSCRERAYPATSAVVPQVSLPHLQQTFSPFLPGQLCSSWNNSWSATVHSPAHDSKPLLAKVQRHSPHPKLSCPHFSI